MKTQVRETSIEAYHSLSVAGAQSQRILNFMIPGLRYSRRLIASRLEMETSTVSARINALLKTGDVVLDGRIDCPVTNKHVEAICRPVLGQKSLDLH